MEQTNVTAKLFQPLFLAVSRPFQNGTLMEQIMTDILQSLSAFCKVHGIPKSTASRRLKDAGFDISDGLNCEAVTKLREMYGLDAVKQSTQIVKRASASIENVDFSTFYDTYQNEVDHVEAEFIDDHEQVLSTAHIHAEQNNMIQDLREQMTVLQARSDATRDHQVYNEVYAGERISLRQNDVMASAKSVKNRQKKAKPQTKKTSP